MAAALDRQASDSAQSRNPVSLRIYKILGTNYNDLPTQDALRTIADIYAPSTSKTTKSGGSKRDSIHDEPSSLIEDWAVPLPRSLENELELEHTPGELAASARKNLRQDMEQKLVETGRQFLKALGEVNEKLESLQQHVNSMRVSCDEAEQHLEATNEIGRSVLEHASNLNQERDSVEERKSIVSLFLARFTLSEEEVQALTTRDVPISQNFFKAMDKSERIREDCRVLMSGEEGPSKAGTDVMATMSSYIEQAYEKLLRWIAHEFRQMNQDTYPDVNQALQAAIQRLRKRPELLNEALTQLCEIRQATNLTSFTTALTRGGPSGLPRPIELHAHDPLRYVGDMLAWVHQAIAAEREFLESLFSIRGDGRMVGSARTFSKANSDEEEWIADMMDASVSKLCVPLKVRIQQTVRSQQSCIVSYKIANLLHFYLVTMTKTIGSAALLSKTIEEITELAFSVFYDEIQLQTQILKDTSMDLNDTAVNPTNALLDHAYILKEVLNVYQSFLSEDPEDSQIERLAKILNVMVDPAIESFTTAAREKMAMRPVWDGQVFMLNCLTFLQDVLEPYSFTQLKQRHLEKVLEEHVAELVTDHYQNLMEDTGLRQIAALCSNQKDKEPLSYQPGARAYEVQAYLHQFSSWLSMADIVQSPRLARLSLQRLHTQIHQAALDKLVDVYQLVCDRIRDPANKYEVSATLLGSERPFGQITLLCQLLGVAGK